jgi:hypothetical protein
VAAAVVGSGSNQQLQQQHSAVAALGSGSNNGWQHFTVTLLTSV